MDLKARVEFVMLMRDGETEDEANNRLYDLLYGQLCQLADHRIDFWIEETYVED